MERQINCFGECLPNRDHANGLVCSLGVAEPYRNHVSRTGRADVSCEEEVMGGLSPIQLDTALQGGVGVAEHHIQCVSHLIIGGLPGVERLRRAARRVRARYPLLLV